MDDEEYARQLCAILTAPADPDLPPGRLGDDFIDRCDGFGTEVQVTAIDVVPGDHGNQIKVSFVLDQSDWPAEHLDVPSEGSLLLPLDAEWREVSGYTEPEDYALHVAMRLVRHVPHHFAAHRPSPSDDRRLPSRAEQHALLLEVLGRHGQVEEKAPDRYVVRRKHGRDLVVLLTPEAWEQVLRRHGLRRHALLEHFDELFGSTPEEERFLVFWEGDATTSTREKLPPVKKPWMPLREMRRQQAEARATGRKFGWFACSPGSEREDGHRREQPAPGASSPSVPP